MKEKIRADWNQIVEEMSEEDQQKELKRKGENRRESECQDGYIETWRKKFTHKGIGFELALLRYFNHELKFKPVASYRICDTHAVVEFIKGDDFVKKISECLNPEFLYYDTLHKWNDKQTRNEQLDVAYNNAIHDIDTVQSSLQERIDEKKEEITELWELKLEALKKSGGKQ